MASNLDRALGVAVVSPASSSVALTYQRRVTLARHASRAGYRVQPTTWAGTRSRSWRVHVLPTVLRVPHCSTVSPCTSCWIEITPHGLAYSGPGYAQGCAHPPTLAGIERARADLILRVMTPAADLGDPRLIRDEWAVMHARALREIAREITGGAS